MKYLTEWGDSWLEHMKPGAYGNEVKFPADETSKADPLPFQGGWGLTGSVFMFLSDLTGDPRFIRPYTEYISSTGKNPPGTGEHLQEIWLMGMYPAEGDAENAKRSHWAAALYTSGDKKPLINALKRNIEELQRFPHMYTTVECFTDRVFLYPAINPSIAYTGG